MVPKGSDTAGRGAGRTWRGVTRRLLPLALLLGAQPVPAAVAPGDWHRLITPKDNARLKTWRVEFGKAVTQARAAGFGPRINAEGTLLQPDAALASPEPPDGAYRCRIFKLGVKLGGEGPPFATLPAAPCRIDEGVLMTLDGVQRHGGRLYRDDGARLVLLGGLALGDEAGMVRYRRDADRNVAGLLERIGPRRWRLLVPHPPWQGLIEVVELEPAE